MNDTEKLIERLIESRRMVGQMCSERRPPKMSIPANPSVDEDLIITLTIADAISALRRLALAEKAAEALRDVPCQWDDCGRIWIERKREAPKCPRCTALSAYDAAKGTP